MKASKGYFTEVISDRGLVSSRNLQDLPAICGKLVEEFAESIQQDQGEDE